MRSVRCTSSPSSSSDRNPVEALAEEFLDRKRRGERPTLDEYCQRHPELADEIRDLFPVLLRMEDIGAESSNSGATTGGAAVHAQPRLERLGDFRILREVARGGMGVVYEAEQVSLGRRVALKVLPDAALADTKQVLRFEREARAAARLHHTNIVPVFGVGHDDGHHFYVMQFIPGMGLDAVLEELRRLRGKTGAARPPNGRSPRAARVSAAAVAEAMLTGRWLLLRRGQPTATARCDAAPETVALTGPSPPTRFPGQRSSWSACPAPRSSMARLRSDRLFFRSVARIGHQVAEALEYANRQGVLHRDIKPSNLLLDPKGNVWVADFGLAKASRHQRRDRGRRHAGHGSLHGPRAVRGEVRPAERRLRAGPDPLRAPGPAAGVRGGRPPGVDPAGDERGTRAAAAVGAPPAARPGDDRRQGDRPRPGRPLHHGRGAGRRPAAVPGRQADPGAAGRGRGAGVAVGAAEPGRGRSLAAGLLLAVAGLAGVTWQWRRAVANLNEAEVANRKSQARFDLAMEAVLAFTNGASEDVILKEKALEGLRKKLLGQSQLFYDKLRFSLEGETDRASRSSLAEALLTRGCSTVKSTRRKRHWRLTARRSRIAPIWRRAAHRPRREAPPRALPSGARGAARFVVPGRRGAGRAGPGPGGSRAAGARVARRWRYPVAGGRVSLSRRPAVP